MLVAVPVGSDGWEGVGSWELGGSQGRGKRGGSSNTTFYERFAMSIILICIIETVGANVLSFLDPKQLFLVSTVNRRFYHQFIHQNIILAVCAQHLQSTIKLGSGSNYLVEFTVGCSFNNITQLWDHLFAKVRPDVRKLYHDKSTAGEELQSMSEITEIQSRRVKLTGSNGEIILTASCNIQEQNRETAKGLVRYIMERNAIRKEKIKEHYELVQDWVSYLIHLRGITIRYWEWDLLCNGTREFGKGLVFLVSISNAVEVRLTRFY